jgi:RNA polymerase sigma-70 factor (ECF subfamily)
MELFDAAARAWPGVHVPFDEFERFAAERPAALPDRTAELYLACACARGDEAALRAFEASYFDEVDRALARLRTSLIDAGEARQLVRERLFVGAGGAPRIATWSGAGSLRAWLRVLATRVLLDRLAQSPRREVPIEEALLEAPLEDSDPELLLLKERCRPQLRAALGQALAALDARQKLLLRCELEGRSLGEVAALYGVHLRSAQRWLRDARDELLEALRRAFGDGDTAQADSMIRLMRSQIASSIVSLVGA